MICIQKKQKLEDKNGNITGNFHGNCCNLLFTFVKKFDSGSRTLTFLTMIHILLLLPSYSPIYMMAMRKCKIVLNNFCNILHLDNECFVEIIWHEFTSASLLLVFVMTAFNFLADILRFVRVCTVYYFYVTPDLELSASRDFTYTSEDDEREGSLTLVVECSWVFLGHVRMVYSRFPSCVFRFFAFFRK